MFCNGRQTLVCRVALGAALSLIVAACSRHPAAGPVRIAVLRFENLTPDASLDWMGRAASEIISHELAGGKSAVLSSSALHGSPLAQDRTLSAPGESAERTAAIAEGATLIVIGQISRAGNHLVLDVTERDAVAGRTADNFTLASPDSSDLYSLADAVARRISPQITPFETRNNEAIAAWARALEETDYAKLTGDYSHAVQADPQYAPAHAALATAYVMALYHGTVYPRDEPLRKARREAARALALDPASAEAYASLAMLSFAFDHDWISAQRGFEKALELNPSDARAHLQYAMGLVTRGRFSQAVAHVNQARVLDPLSFAATNYLAIALYCAGHYDESIAAARQTLTADPGFASAHVAIGRGMAVKGDFPRAAAEFAMAMQKYGREPWILGRMGYALARAGHTAQALGIVKEIDRLEGPAVQIAFVYAGLGDHQRSLDALDRAFQQGNVDLDFMAVEPMLAGLRAEPRFLTLKSRMGL